MKKKGNGDIVVRPWLAGILLTMFLASLTCAGAAARYIERSSAQGRRLDRIERVLERVEKNQTTIATQLGVKLE